MNSLIFGLILIAIGTQEALSSVPSAEEWEEAYDLARKQAVAGVAFYGVYAFVEYVHKKRL